MGVLYAGMIGLVLSDIIPTPGDALYFYQQQKLKKKLEAKEITPQQYWLKEAAGYYLYNSAWWAIVFGVVICVKGSAESKLKIASACIGAGAVVSVLIKNIKKDNDGS